MECSDLWFEGLLHYEWIYTKLFVIVLIFTDWPNHLIIQWRTISISLNNLTILQLVTSYILQSQQETIWKKFTLVVVVRSCLLFEMQ